MKVAVYLPSVAGGGAERAMVTLANGFSARGLKVDMVLSSAVGAYLSEIAKDVRVVDLRARRVATSLPALAWYLRKEKPNALLSALNYANVVAVVAREMASQSTRLIVSERTHVSRSLLRAKSLRARSVLPLMRWAYQRADAVVAVSNGVADDLACSIGLERSRISVVYNPVVTAGLETLAAEANDHPWFEAGQPPVILAVGRLSTAKDYPTLIRAFALVRANRPCRLVILGDGELREMLSALIKELGLVDCVEMPGFFENPFSWMTRAAVFSLSSAWEGLPNVLIQAMACGTPVVSTNCESGPAEILEGGKWGILTPVGDANELSKAIQSQLDNPIREGLRARAKFFSADSAVDSYLSLLSKVMH